MRSTISRAALAAAALSIPFFSQPSALGAQQRSRADERRDAERRETEREARIERVPGGVSVFYGASNRPVLGITLADPSRTELDGVRIEAVEPDGPAAKSGLKAGDVITAINGVSLRVSADDAADPALSGLSQRRLQRALARARAGDVVELRVQQGGGQSRTLSVKTVAASELASNTGASTAGRVLGRSSSDERRGAIGLAIGGSGSVRDTLGLFVSSVVANGPAEKAGIVEGDRIAAVNGVDVRVPREDVEDAGATSARANRFMREVGKIAPGSTVSLRVYAGGRYRDVSVMVVRPSELPSQGFRMSIGDGGISFDMPGSTIYRAPFGSSMGPDSPRVRTLTIPDGQRLLDLDGLRGRLELDGNVLTFDREALRRSMEELRQNVLEGTRGRRMQLRTDDGEFGPVTVRPAPRRTVKTF